MLLFFSRIYMWFSKDNLTDEDKEMLTKEFTRDYIDLYKKSTWSFKLDLTNVSSLLLCYWYYRQHK